MIRAMVGRKRRTSSFLMAQVLGQLRRILPNEHEIAAGRAVLHDCLGAREGEQVLVVYEDGYDDFAAALVMAADEVRAEVDAVKVGVPLIPNIVEKLERRLEKTDVSVLVSSYAFPRDVRTVLTAHRIDARRHAHMLGVTEAILKQSLRADYQAVHELGEQLARVLESTYEIKVESPAGTDLRVRRDPSCRWHNQSGLQREPGWTNLPAGEVATTPLAVDGVFVCDGGIWLTDGAIIDRAESRKLVLRFEHGALVDAEGPDAVRAQLLADVDAHALGRRVGQVAFGTNVGVLAPIGQHAQDVKLPGVHLVLGYSAPDATGASWNGEGMVTVLQRQESVWLDARQIIQRGRFVSSLRPSQFPPPG
ncbi:MAG: aminopeptidase [Sandaracinaceae bacterium]|nr:aminopeptidase [Sandaracinaceae bacterium]